MGGAVGPALGPVGGHQVGLEAAVVGGPLRAVACHGRRSVVPVPVVDGPDGERAVGLGGLHEGGRRHGVLDVVEVAAQGDVEIVGGAVHVLHDDLVGRVVAVEGRGDALGGDVGGLVVLARGHEAAIGRVEEQVQVRVRVVVLVPVEHQRDLIAVRGELHLVVGAVEVEQGVAAVAPRAAPVAGGAVARRGGPEHPVEVARVVDDAADGAGVVVVAHAEPGHGVVDHVDALCGGEVGGVLEVHLVLDEDAVEVHAGGHVEHVLGHTDPVGIDDLDVGPGPGCAALVGQGAGRELAMVVDGLGETLESTVHHRHLDARAGVPGVQQLVGAGEPDRLGHGAAVVRGQVHRGRAHEADVGLAGQVAQPVGRHRGAGPGARGGLQPGAVAGQRARPQRGRGDPFAQFEDHGELDPVRALTEAHAAAVGRFPCLVDPAVRDLLGDPAQDGIHTLVGRGRLTAQRENGQRGGNPADHEPPP